MQLSESAATAHVIRNETDAWIYFQSYLFVTAYSFKDSCTLLSALSLPETYRLEHYVRGIMQEERVEARSQDFPASFDLLRYRLANS